MRIAVVIATAGRRAACAQAIDAVQNAFAYVQGSALGVVSSPTDEDLPPVPDGWLKVTGVRGASAQRNAACAKLPPDTDYVFYFDDDTVIRHDYLQRAVGHFQSHPEVVAVTGSLLADGAREHREVSFEEAIALIEESWARPQTTELSYQETRELYGCNAAVRWSVARDYEFDERLPLYSWLEDHDLARRLLRHGRIHRIDALAVHRGSASGGRASHVRLGYSQVANALWLHEKGSFPLWLALEQILRPVLKNVALSLRPEARYSYRRLRLRGNWAAGIDWLRNRGHALPERILDIE
ncbi:glycosyltransferase family 2 protein [Microbacterium sp. NPDC056569]|uniref:glycosyltransferase family 2 protein n=1 Tax=Microbacterium sp. NPDC056569 TaxID=3345867 RepID=UPI00366AC377